jgi:hypothetical protein
MLSWATDQPLESEFHLDAEHLLEWPEWNELSKEYIADASDQILIAPFVDEHSTAVGDFHAWFRGALVASQRQNLEALAEAERDFAHIAERAFGR